MKKYLYNAACVEPRCELCEHGILQENGVILCKGKRQREPDERCRRFRYDPLKRQPRRTPALPCFDPDEFVL